MHAAVRLALAQNPDKGAMQESLSPWTVRQLKHLNGHCTPSHYKDMEMFPVPLYNSMSMSPQVQCPDNTSIFSNNSMFTACMLQILPLSLYVCVYER